MPDVKGIITHKIGPLPVWAYVVLGAGGVFVISKMRGGGGGGGSSGIPIARFVPGAASGEPSGAIGSPAQNATGGTPPQPSGLVSPGFIPAAPPIGIGPLLPVVPPSLGSSPNPPATAGPLPPAQAPVAAPPVTTQPPQGPTASPVIIASAGQFPGVPAGAPVQSIPVTPVGGGSPVPTIIGLADAFKTGIANLIAPLTAAPPPAPAATSSPAAAPAPAPAESGFTPTFAPVTGVAGIINVGDNAPSTPKPGTPGWNALDLRPQPGSFDPAHPVYTASTGYWSGGIFHPY